MSVRILTLIALFLTLFLTTTALAEHHAVKIASKDGVGSYLTDTKGMAIYWFTQDGVGQSRCAGGCLEKWPIFYRESIKAPAGVDVADFATIIRSDGALQTTFRGYPLYSFVVDKMAGDTSGEGVKGAWFLVDPDDFPKN